jgi:hypothetical protein
MAAATGTARRRRPRVRFSVPSLTTTDRSQAAERAVPTVRLQVLVVVPGRCATGTDHDVECRVRGDGTPCPGEDTTTATATGVV